MQKGRKERTYMNILMVMWDSSGYPPDPRVTKEARTLIAAGHKVHLLCIKKPHQLPEETVNSIQVRRIVLPPEKLKGIEQKLVRLGISSHTHPFWARATEQAAIDFKADIIHCHDLRPVDSTLAITRKHIRLHIIADLHEMYPEAIKYYYPSWKGHAICTLGQWVNRERRALEYSDAAITISQQAKTHYYQKRFSASPHVIRNTVDLEEFDVLASRPMPLAHDLPDRPVIMYEGSYNRRRGIDVLARAFNRIRSETGCCLLLAGAIPEQNIRPLVDERFHNDIIFTGNLPPESIPPLLKRATVLVHPILNTSPQTDYCCPHKIFEYMAAGKPVVASNTMSFEEYIHSTGAGLLAKAGDYHDLARAILQVLRHPADYGSNGRYAVERHYNWSTDGKRLLRLYDSLDTGARREAQEIVTTSPHSAL
jgi:glycosyltransferase involved in cell wall biosynthesis